MKSGNRQLREQFSGVLRLVRTSLSPSDLRLTLIVGGILLACMVAPVPLMSIVSLVVFCAYLIWLTYQHSAFIPKYLYFIYAIVANVAGVAVCEFNDFYLTELQTFTGYHGSLPLIIFSRWLMFPLLLWFDAHWGVEINPDYNNEASGAAAKRQRRAIDYATIACLVLGIGLFIYIARYEPAFLAGLSRFAWKNQNIDSNIFGTISTIYSYLILFPVMSLRYGNKKLGVASLAVYVVSLFWQGVKFGSFFTLLYTIFWVFYDRICKADLRKLKNLVLASLFAVVLLVFAASWLQTTFLNSNKSISDYFFPRLAQQGQLWWATYDIVGDDYHPEQFSNEVEKWGTEESITGNVNSNTGIAMIMYLTAPASYVTSRLTGGSEFTEAGYACAYYYFGPLGTIAFTVLMSLAIGAIVNALLFCVNKAKLLEAVVLLRTSRMAISTLGTFRRNIFEPMSLLCYGYLILSYLIYVKRREKPSSQRGNLSQQGAKPIPKSKRANED